MSRVKFAAILAVAAFVCLLAPTLADQVDPDWKDDNQGWTDDRGEWKDGQGDWKDDKRDWKDDHADWRDDHADWKDGHGDWKDDKQEWKDDKHDGKSGEWEGNIEHTEFLVCKYCGDYSTLVNQLLLGGFNMVKAYGPTDLDTALCYTLHITYVFIVTLDKLLEQNLHAITEGLTRLLKEVMAHPKLSKVLKKTGLECVGLFRCAMTILHKNLIF